MNTRFQYFFPQIDNVAKVSDRNTFTIFLSGFDALHEFIQVNGDFCQPSLSMTGVEGFRIDLGDNIDSAGNNTGFCLGAGHAAKSGSNKCNTFGRCFRGLTKILSSCVQDCYRCAVNDPLRADVHIASGRHLAIGSHAEAVIPQVILWLRIVRYHQSIRYNYSGSPFR